MVLEYIDVLNLVRLWQRIYINIRASITNDSVLMYVLYIDDVTNEEAIKEVLA